MTNDDRIRNEYDVDLIHRKSVLDKLCEHCRTEFDGNCPNPYGRCKEYEVIDQIPQFPFKHGHWIDTRIQEVKECSECGDWYTMPLLFVNDIPHVYPYNFCPNCGADLRETFEADESEEE